MKFSWFFFFKFRLIPHEIKTFWIKPEIRGGKGMGGGGGQGSKGAVSYTKRNRDAQYQKCGMALGCARKVHSSMITC